MNVARAPSPAKYIARSLIFFRRQLEIDQVPAEASGLDRPESNSYSHPDCPHNLRWAAQIEPQQQTDQKSRQRWNEIRNLLFVFAHVVTHEGREIYAHECDQCAEVQHLSAQSVAD